MHEYIIGKSGTGKTTFLQNLILQNEGGFAVLDPHGDLAETIADTVECIYFDPTELPIAHNVLHNVPERQRHLVTAQVVASFRAIWADSWGHRLEWILYNSVRLLLDNNQTLLDIPAVLTDTAYRTRCLKRATHRKFWDNEFAEWDSRYRNEAIAPVLNKVGQLVADPNLRQTLGQQRSTLNIERIMNKGQRLVVNLSKGKLGETPSSLLGSLIISAFSQAAEMRANIPYEDRVPFTIYIDEFASFATDDFATILSESRKWKLSLVLAHQFLGQVPPLLRQAVFGNVRKMVAFRLGAEDAPLIAAELGLGSPSVLTDLDNFEAWTRVGGPYNSEFIRTPPPRPTRGHLEAAKRFTRASYCRPKFRVEAEVGRFVR
jgi:hypothetical protein